MNQIQGRIIATYPLDERSIAVVFSSGNDAETATAAGLRLLSGPLLTVRELTETSSQPTVIATIEPTRDTSGVIDRVVARGLGPAIGGKQEFTGPPFMHGIQSPLGLKIPYIMNAFPFSTTLAGIHVSVACCTGCNGGIHGRNFVVLNNHIGGPFSGIWVRTPKPIPVEYARWQKVEFVGGILRDLDGSVTVVDDGWMDVRLGDEVAHHAPQPMRVSTRDFPVGGTNSLLAASLDACWVEFTDITVEGVVVVEGDELDQARGDLPHVEIRFKDSSGVEAVSWMYQRSARDMKTGDQLRSVRGFMRVEMPGRIVLLSDKEEDLVR